MFPNPYLTKTPFADPVFVESNEVYSLSATAAFHLYDTVRINVGVRYDDREGKSTNPDAPGGFDVFTNDPLSYNGSVVYSFGENLHAYYSYGESTEYLLASACGGNTLEPETGTSHEVGVKWEIRPRLLGTIAYFDNETSNAPEPVQCDLGTSTQLFGSVNSDAIRFGKGVELELIGNISDAWNIIFGYSHLDDGFDDGREFSSPKNTASMFSLYEFLDGPFAGFGFGGGFRYIGDREPDLLVDGVSGADVALPDIFTVDAALYYRLSDNVSLTLNGHNLNDDEIYTEWGAIYCCVTRDPGRNFTLTADFTF